MDCHISGGGEEILLLKYYSPSSSFTFRRRKQKETKRSGSSEGTDIPRHHEVSVWHSSHFKANRFPMITFPQSLAWNNMTTLWHVPRVNFAAKVSLLSLSHCVPLISPSSWSQTENRPTGQGPHVYLFAFEDSNQSHMSITETAVREASSRQLPFLDIFPSREHAIAMPPCPIST